MLPIVLSVIVSEVFVDCVKHAFITKFNSISPDVYRTYRLTLAKDLTDSRSKRVRMIILWYKADKKYSQYITEQRILFLGVYFGRI